MEELRQELAVMGGCLGVLAPEEYPAACLEALDQELPPWEASGVAFFPAALQALEAPSVQAAARAVSESFPVGV